MVVETTIARLAVEVRVRVRMALVRVTHADGYQLVVGGRLLLDVRGGERHPHPELPPYTLSDFPVSVWDWDEDGPVTVEEARKGGRMRRLTPVAAYNRLFVTLPPDAARAFLRGGCR